jgi:uncharacterized protein DUF5906/bifunctional DNA primase/polymerase-like protein
MTEDISTGIITEFFTGGWRVAPFIKTPEGYIGVKAWPKRAATNPAELQALMEEQSGRSTKTPILGIVPARGKYVVDIDTKKNVSALQLWKEKVVEAYGDLGLGIPNLVVKTKSGGYHLYYSDGTDRHLHSPTSIFSKDSGIDIRGYTGMVVAPTSMGTAEDWQLGDYTIIKGRPTDPLTVLGLSKILGDSYDETDTITRMVLRQVNEALRNDSINEWFRHRMIPDAFVIPSSSRDNTLYKCARLCRLAGLTQDAAFQFMGHIALRCEATDEEPAEHWTRMAMDKVKRVYASETEMKMQTVSGFFDELDNSGTVLLRGVSKSYLHFRHGSQLLRIEPRSTYSVDNIGNVLQGTSISSDDGEILVKKVIANYQPKEVAYNVAMYPKRDMPFFDYEGKRYVNSYHDPFAAFEPIPDMMEQANEFIELFNEFTRHITGYEEGDMKHLLDKLAWMVQKPYRRLPTGTIIYSHTRGSGKDLYMSLVREIIGRQYYMPITLQSIESDHTMLHDKIVCVASEVQLQTNSRGTVAAAAFMGKLKDIITAKTVYVNEKFVQPYSAPIFTNFFLLSNFELSSVIEPGDRRFDVFHAAEQKLDQSRLSKIADISNDGVWVERTEDERLLRKHVIYAIRRSLQERKVDPYFDRDEAVMNEVKASLMASQNPPSLDWMLNNLPAYFTEDVAMMACHFCPMRITPDYVMKQLREHFGPSLKTLYRSNRIVHRLSGAPRFERRSDGGGQTIPMLDFESSSSDPNARKQVYYFDGKIRDVSVTDVQLKGMLKTWYGASIGRFYGNMTTLPNQKPDGDAKPDLV